MSELILPDYFSPIDLDAAFPRRAPVEIDVGCGEGAFLVEMAKRHPERNFLGLERLRGRVRNTALRATRAGLTNCRVLRIDSAYFLHHLLPAASVSAFHILFPDPWPKHRHWRRRLITASLLDSLHRALVPSGELCIVTDHAEYLGKIERLAAVRSGWKLMPWPEEEQPASGFERRFRERGLPIYRLRVRNF